jgi:hypothetical protein
LFESNRIGIDADLPIEEGFLELKNTKPEFLAEIRALACVAADDGWLMPCTVPSGYSLCSDSTNARGLGAQNARP